MPFTYKSSIGTLKIVQVVQLSPKLVSMYKRCYCNNFNSHRMKEQRPMSVIEEAWSTAISEPIWIIWMLWSKHTEGVVFGMNVYRFIRAGFGAHILVCICTDGEKAELAGFRVGFTYSSQYLQVRGAYKNVQGSSSLVVCPKNRTK